MTTSNKTFKHLNRLLEDYLDIASQKPEYFINPDSSFSRDRKISRSMAVRIPYMLTEQSISNEIPQFSGNSHPELTGSAITQARQKVSSDFYVDVFHHFNSACDSLCNQSFKGYGIFAVDGSEIRVRLKDGDSSTVGSSKKGGRRSFYHLNALYDSTNHYYLDAVIQPGSQKNEDKALLTLALKYRHRKAIWTADRGYEYLMNFYRFQQAGIRFVIRIKNEESSTSLLKHYSTPESEEYDIPFDVVLTSKNNRFVKNHWDTYKYISGYRHEPEFSNGTAELPLHLRAVRFKAVSEGKESIITLLTSLSFDEFSTEDVKTIYCLRWQEEISFRDLKHKLDLEKIHSQNRQLVISEIFARMTLYNFCSFLRTRLQKTAERRMRRKERKKELKYPYAIDFGFLVSQVKKWLFRQRVPVDLCELMVQRIQPVRKGRANKR